MRENGCLQVIKGSHRLGRVDHVLCGEQLQADPERVSEVSEGRKGEQGEREGKRIRRR